MRNNILLQLLLQSLLIWLTTNVIAALCYLVLTAVGFQYEPFLCVDCINLLGIMLLIGVAASSPANILLIPILYILTSISVRSKQILWGIACVLLICLILIIFYFNLFAIPNRERFDISLFLIPYIFGAVISFLLLSRKVLYKTVGI